MPPDNSDRIEINLTDRGYLLLFLAGIEIVTNLSLGFAEHKIIQSGQTIFCLTAILFNLTLVSLSFIASRNDLIVDNQRVNIGKVLSSVIFVGIAITNYVVVSLEAAFAIALLIIGNCLFILVIIGLNIRKK